MKTRISLFLSLCLGLISTSVAGSVRADDVCITEEARRSVTTCEAGPADVSAFFGTQNRPQVQIRGGIQQQAPTQTQRGPAVITGVGAEGAIEGDRRARALGILRQETVAIRQLVQATRTTDPTRPEVIGRLAETYTELQASLRQASGQMDEQLFCSCPETRDEGCDQSGAPAASPELCQQKEQEKQRLETELAEAHQQGNRTLAMLVRDHPDYPQLDRIMFSLAYGLQRVGQEERAQQVYLQLASRFPQSRYVPHAFLAFGEFFFNQNMMEDAQQAYERVLTFGLENNSVYGYAIFKLAWVHYNQNDYEHSLSRFEEALQYTTDNPRSLAADQIVSETLRNIVMPYAMSRGPDRALRDFMSYARNDRTKAMRMYEELALFYYDNGDWANAINGFKLLQQQLPESEKLCVWSGMVVDATMRSRPKADTVNAMNDLRSVYERFAADESQPVDARRACQAKTASVIYILATQWHIEAVGGQQGADGSRGGGAGTGREVQGTQNRDTMRQAANLYELLLTSFTNLDEIDWEAAGGDLHIRREDLPDRYHVAYYYADLLYQSEDWERCGPAFELVTQLNAQGEFNNDAAGAAVRCYIKYYDTTLEGREGGTAAAQQAAQQAEQAAAQQRGGRAGRNRRQAQAPVEAPPTTNPADGFARREFTPLEAGMLRAFGRFACVADASSEDMIVIKYRRARVLYEANHFEEAAVLFRDIAMNHKGQQPQDEFAANLYFDSLNVLGSQQQPARPACVNQMETDSRPVCTLYCSNDADRARYGDLCSFCGNIECNILKNRAQSYHNAREHLRAAETYEQIVNLNTSRPADQQCDEMDKLIWNMAVEYQAAYQVGMAIQVRTALIEAYPTSPLAKKSAYLIGANFHAIAWYDQAADWYERFARENPTMNGQDCTQEERDGGACPVAYQALMNATLFRLGLGDIDKAKADADLFARTYGRERAYEAAKVQYAVGSFYEHRQRWAEVVLYYTKYLRDYRNAPAHLLLQAQALIGRAYRLEGRQDRKRQMLEAYTQAVRLWETGRIPERLQALPIPDGEKARILIDTVNAAAEAYFYLAEVKFDEVQAIRFPTYSGGADDQRIMQWVQRDFLPWGVRRQAAVSSAVVEYDKVKAISVPFTVNGSTVNIISEAWQIAAAARVGQMYRETVDAFRNVPIPEVVDQNPELYEIYVGALENAASPLLESAKGAFLFCLTSSTNARWFNEWSRQCEEELARIDPAQYPAAVELRGPGGLEHVPPAWPPAVEGLDSAGGSAAPATGEGGAAAAAAPAAAPAPAPAGN